MLGCALYVQQSALSCLQKEEKRIKTKPLKMGNNNTQNYLLKKTNKRKGSSCNYIREIMEESHPQTKKRREPNCLMC